MLFVWAPLDDRQPVVSQGCELSLAQAMLRAKRIELLQRLWAQLPFCLPPVGSSVRGLRPDSLSLTPLLLEAVFWRGGHDSKEEETG